MKLYAPSTIKGIRNKYDFRPTKSLGQNFLTDKNIIDKIIDAADIKEEDLVIEIGPGLGVLTYEAAQRAKKVVSIEIDKKLLPILEENLADCPNVEIINNDILKTNLNEIIGEWDSSKVKIIGNLPYYITTPIIFDILEKDTKAASIVIMMQKEVAERIKAGPGSKTYGPLSVAVQFYCTVDYVSTVPKEVFYPVPKVDSAVLRLNIRENPPVRLNDRKLFFSVISAGFGQRRKTLLNSLSSMGFSKDTISRCLKECDIDPVRRAETLSLNDFADIANNLYGIK